MFKIVSNMTMYEILAVSIALIALVQPWIISLWKCFFRKLKVSFLPTSSIKLFYNRSGAYIDLDGVIKAENKAAIIEKISVKVIRQTDKAELFLEWSVFLSPLVQSFAGNTLQSNEIAHPFAINKDSLYPAFIEFASSDYNLNNILKQKYDDLNDAVQSIVSDNKPYLQAKAELQDLEKYKELREILLEFFYWKAANYTIELFIKYGDNEIKKNKYKFDLSQEESDKLKQNIDKTILYYLNQLYRQNNSETVLYVAQKDFEVAD